jgi:hypothetical protein
VHLKSYAEVSPEIEQLSLCINIKIIYHSKAPEKKNQQRNSYLHPSEIMEAVL